MERDAYRDAGVDINAAMATKGSIKSMVRSTFGPEVLTDIGSFGGLFKPNFTGLRNPVLVASADGVGTKIKVACLVNRHDTVGKDLVNHCCNDILVMGAHPLFFLDYVAYAKHDDSLITAVINGITQACRAVGCALIGGEMAELPDLYHSGEYDLAGVIIGVVGESDILDGSKVSDNDIILGIASSGLHTNGYTLARKLIFTTAGLSPHDTIPRMNLTVADALLEVHRCYVSSVLPLVRDGKIHALAHITGGGFPGNINRSLPKNYDAVVDIDSWDIPPLFLFLKEVGNLSDYELYRTFNMGIGMTLIVSPENVDAVSKALEVSGETVYKIGRIIPGSGEVSLNHGL